MKLLLTTSGTRGDFQPLLSLALAAQRSGHEVLLVARASFAGSARDAGVTFEALRDDGRIGPGRLPRGVGDIKNLGPSVWPILLSDFATLVPIIDRFDVVIGTGTCFSIPPIAGAFDKPFATISFFPLVMESSAYPPRHVEKQTLGAAENLVLWKQYKQAIEETMAPLLERLCESHGLPEPDGFVYAPEQSACTIIACDPRIAPLPADIRHHECVQTGFIYLEQSAPLAMDVERFLGAGDPPIFISFGSVIPDDVPALRAVLSEALRRAGCRAIIGRGLGGVSAEGPRVMCVGDVDHQTLFPRTAGVIHHGGSGTVAASARAGVAQLAVPFVNDEFYWGHRIHALGLGPEAILARELTADALTARLSALVADDQARNRAHALAEQIDPALGVQQALATIERVFT